MMSLFSNIPAAIINNIGFMAILCLLYQLGKLAVNLPTILYSSAIFYQVVGGLFFIFSIINPNTNTTYFISASLSYSLLPIVGILYCILLGIYLIRWAVQLKQTIQIKNSVNLNDNLYWQSQLNEFYIQLPKNLKIGYSDKIVSPITLGFIEPIILLPISVLNQLSTQEIKLILLHELAHIIHHDYLFNLLLELIHSVLFFNPFSYYFKKEINLQREIIADENVVKITQEPLSYTKTLYHLATVNKIKSSLPFTMSAINTTKELMERIQFMNKINSKKKFINVFPIFLTVLMVLFVFLNVQPHKENKKVLNTLTTSMARFTKFESAKPIIKHLSNHKKQVPKTPIIVKYELAFKAPSYNNLVNETAQWIKEHENPAHFASYEQDNDSLEYDIAEKLIVQSIVKNYALKKEILREKLEKVADEKEAYDYLMNSKEWEQMMQYDKWAKAFLKKHPGTFTPADSLRSF